MDFFSLAISIPPFVWKALHRYGVLVFVGMGLIDNSIFPTPGGMDALVIILSAHRREEWWYYAIVATVGSVIGASLTYYLARKGGEEALQKKLGKRAEKINRAFGRYGFWSVFLSSLAPPPVPTAAFVATAGALRYSQKMFLLAITSGRVLRFAIVAWIASRYGTQLFQFFGKYYKPALWTMVSLAVVGGIAALIYWQRRKREKHNEPAVPAQKAA